ncbi:MAG: NosD domain-containing protein [Trueperaceae bacterium]
MKQKSLWSIVSLLFMGFILGGCGVQTSEFASPTPGGAVAEDFATLEPVATGKTYYVSGTGNDTNDGLSKGKAFRTLQKAADLTNPGDTVLAMNGTYTKTVEDRLGPDNSVLRINRPGRSDAYITYKAMPGHAPRIYADGNWQGIRINVPYIVIEGFIVEGNSPKIDPEEALAVATGTDADAALFNPNFNTSGIMTFGNEGLKRDQITEFNFPHHIIIRKNTVFNFSSGGIGSNSSDYIRVENNVVYSTSNYSAYAGSGISFYSNWNLDNSTDTKMYIRKNVVYNVENKVPFWYSSTDDPSQRKITDGNGIIIDDANHSQSDKIPYVGRFLIENNLVFDNGGRGINVYESKGVTVRNNTTYNNGRTPNFTELGVQAAEDVKFIGNIFSVAPDKKPIFTYGSDNILFENNLFYGGSEAPQYPPRGDQPGGGSDNLITNGDFTDSIEGWQLSNGTPGFVSNSHDATYKRNCTYIDTPGTDTTNIYDIYIYQTGLTLKQGFSYTLKFDVATSNKIEANFAVKLGKAGATYAFQTFSLPVNDSRTSLLELSLDMTAATDDAAEVQFQIAGNAESSYFCFDNIILTEIDNSTPVEESKDILGQDPLFVKASTDPKKANFSLKKGSPAIDKLYEAEPSDDIRDARRPRGTASDMGAYESY